MSETGSIAPDPTALILFRVVAARNGNLGGRSGADAVCATDRVSYTFAPDNQCVNTRALVSFNAGDQLRDIPANYGISSAKPLRGPTGISVANNWADLMDGSIAQTLAAAGVSDNWWWSFSNPDGTVNAFGCSGGTGTSGSGMRGDNTTASSTWMQSGGSLCTTPLRQLCVCY